MNIQHRGHHSFCPISPPCIYAWASTAGTKEAEGPLAKTFDNIGKDNLFGEKTWEQAEQAMQRLTLDTLI